MTAIAKPYELYALTTDKDNKATGTRLIGQYATRREMNDVKSKMRTECATVAYAYGQFAGIVNKRAA